MTDSCKYCGKHFKNVNLHITKVHTQFTKYWKTTTSSSGRVHHYVVRLERKIENEPIEIAINAFDDVYYFQSDVKKTKYYNTSDEAEYGLLYNTEVMDCLTQYSGYTNGFTRSNGGSCCNIKNHKNIILRKKPQVATK